MLNQHFLQGDYHKTIADALGRTKLLKNSELPSLVGAYCFAGNLLEAKKLYKDSHGKLNDNEKAACRFFLGLLYTRKSQYKKAFKIFHLNLKSLKKDSDSLQKFYVYQGIAFYLFFLGKFQLSMKWALKSFHAAHDASDLYARSLSTDLLAHNKLRLGEVNVGLDLLKTADKLSKTIGNKSVSGAISSAELQYRAHLGYDRLEIVTILEKNFSNLVSEDNYSRGAIGLELARQYTLRGQFDFAEEVLEKITSNIYSSENRRQEIQLNLRFAENYYRLGKKSQAWNYLRAARRCLNYEVDKSFEIQINGFELKLFSDEDTSQLKIDLINKMRDFNTIINHNILLRKKIIQDKFFNREDLYHDFLVSLNEERDPISVIIESKYWSLLPEKTGFDLGETGLYLDCEMNVLILFLDKKIEVLNSELTPLDMKLLVYLLNSSGVNEKAEICKYVWGYEYDPLRHDNVIYTAIRSLRKTLLSAGTWIETVDNGYRFSNERKFKIIKRAQYIDKGHYGTTQDSQNSQEESLAFATSLLSSGLNYRQVKALDYLKVHEYLDVVTYQKLYQVSDVTASRDLRDLKKCGFMVSIGKARATKYLLASVERNL